MQGRQDKTWVNQLATGHDGGGRGDLGHEWMVGLSWRWGHPEKGYFRRKIQLSLGVSKQEGPEGYGWVGVFRKPWVFGGGSNKPGCLSRISREIRGG